MKEIEKVIIIMKDYSRTGMTQIVRAFPLDPFVEGVWKTIKEEIGRLGGKVVVKCNRFYTTYETRIRGYGMDFAALLAQNLIEKGYTVKKLY